MRKTAVVVGFGFELGLKILRHH